MMTRLLQRWRQASSSSSMSMVRASLAVSKRGALTDGQSAILDHAFRQLLSAGPCLITHLTRKLPDSVVDVMDDMDGSLLDYLKRNRKFVVRSMPVPEDVGSSSGSSSSRRVIHLVSLSAAEAVTTIRHEGRKVALAVHDIIAANSTAHLVGHGMPIPQIVDRLNTSQRKVVHNCAGDLQALVCSHENVFEVNGNHVRLLDERTPFRPFELAVAAPANPNATTSSTPVAVKRRSSSDNDSGMSLIPKAPSMGSSSSSTVQRSAGGITRHVPLSDDVIEVIHILRSIVPFDAFVRLDEILAHPPTVSALQKVPSMELGKDGLLLPGSVLRRLEQIPSSALDCRVFARDGDNNPRLVFLRLIGDEPSITQAVRPDVEHGDDSFALKRHVSCLPYTWDLLHTVLRQYEASLGAQEIAHWFEKSFGNSSSFAGGVEAAVEHLPPMEMPSLCKLCAQVERLVQAMPQPLRRCFVGTPTEDEDHRVGNGEAEHEDNTQAASLFVLLLFDRLPHLFDVNWQTFEARVRREVMAAWWEITHRLPPGANNDDGVRTINGTTTPSSAASLVADGGGNSDCVQPSLASVLELALSSSRYRALCNNTLRMGTTPVQRALRQTRDAMETRFQPGSLTVTGLINTLHPQSVKDNLIDAFGSAENFVRFHSTYFLIRDQEGNVIPPSKVASAGGEDDDAGAKVELRIWTPSQVAMKRAGEAESNMAALLQQNNHHVEASSRLSHGGLQVESSNRKRQQQQHSSWSDNTIAKAFYDTLPDDSETVVIWRSHIRQLALSHSDRIPPAVLGRAFSVQFFQDRPNLFDVFELLDGGAFVVGRRGVRPPAFGIHRPCRSIEDAIKQLAIVTVGGKTMTRAMMCLSTDARTWMKRYGGVEVVAAHLSCWFHIHGDLITYVGADSSTDSTQTTSASHCE